MKKRPNLAIVAAAAAGVPLGAFWFADRPQGPPAEETLASFEPVAPEGPRVEFEPVILAEPTPDEPPRPVVANEPFVETPPTVERALPASMPAPPPAPGADPVLAAVARAAEDRALRTLDSIAHAQAVLKATVAIDTNGDRVGEFGYLAELAGSVPHRVEGHRGAYHGPRGGELRPAVLTREFGDLSPTSHGSACEIDGFLFSVHLPGARRVSGRVEGLPEATHGGSGEILPDPVQSSEYWCVYAWPVSDSSPPKRAFFMDASGAVLSTSNDESAYRRYVGHARAPRWSAAFARADMAGDHGDDGANDGNEWRRP